MGLGNIFGISSLLRRVLELEEQILGVVLAMANDQTALDAAIADNTQLVTKYIADVQVLVQRLESSGVANQFSAEIAQLRNSGSALTTADTTATSDTTGEPAPAPAEPAPAPAEPAPVEPAPAEPAPADGTVGANDASGNAGSVTSGS